MSSLRGFRRRAFCASLIFAATATAHAGELEDRFTKTQSQAQAGNPAAMYALGEMYELGMGTDSSKAKAIEWYKAAADKGHSEGLYQIGYAYYWGKNGFKKDRKQAHDWFSRAAEAGSQAAMPYLSKMYRLGQGVKRDRALAEVWSARAAAHSSTLHTAPPTPESRPAPKPEPKPEPAPVVVQQPTAAPVVEQPAVVTPPPRPAPASAPKPAPVLQVQAPRVAKPKPQPKAQVAEAAKPAPKPVAAPKPQAASVDPLAQQKARLLGAWWQKGSRPSLYLPSSQTSCTADGNEGIACSSQPRRSSLLGRPYAFQFKAYLETFDRQGRFAMRYWPVVTEVLPIPPGAYSTGEDAAPPPTEDQIRQHIERPAQELSCEMFKDSHMLCIGDKDGELRFDRIDQPKR